MYVIDMCVSVYIYIYIGLVCRLRQYEKQEGARAEYIHVPGWDVAHQCQPHKAMGLDCFHVSSGMQVWIPKAVPMHGAHSNPCSILVRFPRLNKA